MCARALQQCLPDGKSGRLLLGDKVVLTHLLVEEGEPGTIDLSDEPSDPLHPFPGEGVGSAGEKSTDTLASIIERINTSSDDGTSGWEDFTGPSPDWHRLPVVRCRKSKVVATFTVCVIFPCPRWG